MKTNSAPGSSDSRGTRKGGLGAFLDGALAIGLIALLLFGPLAFGAVENWSLLVLRAGAALLLLLWATRQVLKGSVEIIPNSLYRPMLLFAILVLGQLLAERTAYYDATVTEATNYVAYGLIFFLASQVFCREKHAAWLLWTLAVFGFLLALFALIQDLTFTGKIYWIRQPRASAGVYGPYVNHNHYAGIMELLAPVPLALALSRRNGASKRWLLGFMAIVMASTVFLSLSRAGMVSVMCQLLFLAIYLFRSNRSPRRLLALGVLAFGTLVFALLIGTGELAERVSSLQNPTDDSVAGLRIAIARDSLRMISERPVLGWGLGVFPTVYPRYRTFYTDLFVNQAHNDYLQALVETGFLGFAVIVWFLVMLFRTGFSKLRRGHSSHTRTATLAALTGITGLLVHSWADFNLHIPANAAMFYAFCALASNRPNTAEPR
ncbi:MAG: O-antigen ligase family protein [Acidobacteria bacterium]|nr:O-antigen ligase family protein [Acidobacteriota bacterium]